MPSTPQLVAQMNFNGGLNLTTDPIHVKDNETTDCQNVDFDVRGAVKKRLGSLTRGLAFVASSDLLLPYNTPGGAATLLVVRQNQVALSVDTSYVQTAVGALTQSASALNSGQVAGGAAYIVNNSDATLKVVGTTPTRLGITAGATGNQPKARYIAFHKGRLFWGNTDAGSSRSRVRFSGSDANPADLEYFKSTSFIDFDPDDGDEITALVPFLDTLVVFKRDKIFSLRGQDPRSFTRVLANPSLGCVAPRTAVPWEQGVIFLSARGVFSFDGARVTRMSEKIDPALYAIPAANLASAVGVIFRQRYHLFVNEASGFNDTVYVFDFVTGTWTRYKGWRAGHAAVWNRVGADELFATDDQNDNALVQLQSGTSDFGLPQPGPPTLAQFATGGTLSNGTYRYKVTAVNATGETMASATADITLTGGTSTQRVEVTAPTVAGATAYGFYGRSTTPPQLKIGQQAGVTFNDTGSVTPSGASPAADGTVRTIDAYWTSKWLDFGVPERRKMGRRLYLFFVASGNYSVNVDVQKGYQAGQKSSYVISLDPGGGTWDASLWDVAFWDSGLEVIRRRVTGLGTQTAFRTKVFDNSVNPWTFEGMSFVVVPRNLA